jgi:hypothetical protein
MFHVVANFNRVIDKVRNTEYRKASEENKAVFKGAKYLRGRGVFKSPFSRATI